MRPWLLRKAADGNRTRIIGLEGRGSTIELPPRAQATDTEPGGQRQFARSTPYFASSPALPPVKLDHTIARATLRMDACHGEWRSLVAHPAGGRAVAGSNPVSPTNELPASMRFTIKQTLAPCVVRTITGRLTLSRPCRNRRLGSPDHAPGRGRVRGSQALPSSKVEAATRCVEAQPVESPAPSCWRPRARRSTSREPIPESVGSDQVERAECGRRAPAPRPSRALRRVARRPPRRSAAGPRWVGRGRFHI